MKRILALEAIQSGCLFVLVSVWLSSTAVADPVGMAVDNSFGRVHVFDAGSDTVLATLNLGAHNADGDCSITADGTRGFATTFTSKLHIIDLTNPSSPSLVASPGISNFGEDTSISPDQQYVVVSDGIAFQPLSVVDIATQSEISTLFVGRTNAVEVLSDGTVLTADLFAGRVYKLTIDGAGNLSNTGQFLSGVPTVVNVYGDPSATAGFTVVTTITSFLVRGMTAVDTRRMPGTAIAGAFHPAGDKIYARTTNGHVVAYSFNSVTGALGATPLFDVLVAGARGFFGMDQLAVTPDGSKLYVSSANSLKVFDANIGTLLNTITNAGFGSLTGVCFTPPSGPITSNVLATPNPVAINTAITLTANVDDTTTGGSEIASAAYTINGAGGGPMDAQDVAFDEVAEDVTADIGSYAEAGVHTLCVSGADADGNIGAKECTLLAVYDADAGFVTGSGWIDSPAGACQFMTACTTAVGKANFGFVSKYKNGAQSPTGSTEFQFRAGDLNFHSDSYEWLVIANHRAQYKGVGTINGGGNYGFMLFAIDANLTPSTDVDLFRIKIWDKDNGDVNVYDNESGDDADPTIQIGGGSIMIHTEGRK